MTPSTLVLTALAQLNEQLVNDDAFMGYDDDIDGTCQLLADLWSIYEAFQPDSRAETPEELVNSWYEDFYAQQAA
jgi:hypothetical protein